MLFFVLSIQFVLCWSGKPLDYTPLLQYLDDDIIRDLTDPVNGRGQILIDYVKRYNSRLEDSRDMIEQNVYEAYIKAKELQKIGGPQFLKANIDRELLKKVFNWTDNDLTLLQKEFDSTKKMWKEVQATFEAAESAFKQIQEQDAKEKAEQAEAEQNRIKNLRKSEEKAN